MKNTFAFVLSNDVLLEGDINSRHIVIHFSDIKPFWEYATEEDYEDGKAVLFGEKLLFTMRTASGQGGIVAVWNTETNQIEHLSEASYCVAAAVKDEVVYILRCISNFVTPAKLMLTAVDYGVIDAFDEGKEINCTLPKPDDTLCFEPEKTELVISAGNINIQYKGDAFPIECIEV